MKKPMEKTMEKPMAKPMERLVHSFGEMGTGSVCKCPNEGDGPVLLPWHSIDDGWHRN